MTAAAAFKTAAAAVVIVVVAEIVIWEEGEDVVDEDGDVLVVGEEVERGEDVGADARNKDVGLAEEGLVAVDVGARGGTAAVVQRNAAHVRRKCRKQVRNLGWRVATQCHKTRHG